MTQNRSPIIDLLCSIVLPSLILLYASDIAWLGATGAFIIALSIPLMVGLFDIIWYRNLNVFAALGLVSILFTGGIGLLQIDNEWLAVKEAAVPSVIGIIILISTFSKQPLINKLLLSPVLFDITAIKNKLHANGYYDQFLASLTRYNYYLSGTFFFSAVMNYFLTTWIVISPSGTEAFNKELAQLTLISYPVIALPSMIMMFLIMYFIYRDIHQYTGLKLEEMLANST